LISQLTFEFWFKFSYTLGVRTEGGVGECMHTSFPKVQPGVGPLPSWLDSGAQAEMLLKALWRGQMAWGPIGFSYHHNQRYICVNCLVETPKFRLKISLFEKIKYRLICIKKSFKKIFPVTSKTCFRWTNENDRFNTNYINSIITRKNQKDKIK
jgi:hypothetical protein